MALTPGAEEVFFESLVTGDVSGAIMNQEKRGQAAFNAADILPRDWGRKLTLEQLAAHGFQIGDPVDDLFVQGKLPTGWQKVATSHSMHTDIIDDKQRHRGGVFYKAAFYDRSAHGHLACRYNYSVQPVGGYGATYDENATHQEGVVFDNGVVVYRDPVLVPKRDWPAEDALRARVKAWIEEHYPNYADPFAYWD